MWIVDHFFIHHCGIADFWRCASISHTVTGRFLTILGEMTHADKRMNTEHILGPIRHTPTSGLMQKFGFKSRITFWAWRSLCSVSALVIITTVTASLYNFQDRSVGQWHSDRDINPLMATLISRTATDHYTAIR